MTIKELQKQAKGKADAGLENRREGKRSEEKNDKNAPTAVSLSGPDISPTIELLNHFVPPCQWRCISGGREIVDRIDSSPEDQTYPPSQAKPSQAKPADTTILLYY